MSVTFLRSATLAASLLFAVSATANNGLENEAMRLLHLADVTVQDIDLPAAAGMPFTTRVDLGGLPFTLDVSPHSVRALGYEIYEDDGYGLVALAPGEINTFRGELLEDPGSIVAGSLLPDGLYAKIMLTSGDMYWIEPLVSKTSSAVYGQHAVYHQDDVLSTPGICAADRLAPVGDVGFTTQGDTGPAATGLLKVCELGCDADYQFYTAHGSSTTNVENRINLVINTMNTQYETEVGIRHDITVIIVRTSNGAGGYTSSDPSTLLNQFRTEWTSNQAGQPRDVAHLFTGKNLNGSVIGIAWLGVICDASFGYGLVQSDCCGSLSCSTDLSAHEIGHNWNADHCSCSGFTMNSSLTCANQFHNTFTEPTIIAFRDTRTCLTDDVNGTLIYLDDFESGNFTAGGWTTSSSARCKVKVNSAFSGTYGAKLKKGGVGTGACMVGTDETWIYTPSFSTMGFTTVNALMHAHFRQNELNCEAMDVQYSVSGGAWVTFGSVETHAWNTYDFPLPMAAVNQADVRIRFITNAKGQKERAELDDFCVVGN